MLDKEPYSSEEQTILLPPRSEIHGSKRKRLQKKEKVQLMESDDKEKETDKKTLFNFQLLFLRFIVLIFITMIILTVMYPDLLKHLTRS